MLYAMGGDSLPEQLLVYRYLNRSVMAQELDLTAAQRDSILHQIQWYAQPENVNYRYDYYRDNCATRVRDIIDNAIGGQMRAKAGELAGHHVPMAHPATDAGPTSPSCSASTSGSVVRLIAS